MSVGKSAHLHLFSFINTIFDIKFIDVIGRAINRVKALRFKYFLIGVDI